MEKLSGEHYCDAETKRTLECITDKTQTTNTAVKRLKYVHLNIRMSARELTARTTVRSIRITHVNQYRMHSRVFPRARFTDDP